MTKHKVFLSNGAEVDVESGTLLSSVLKSMGIAMDYPCGGIGKCGRCQVTIAVMRGIQEREKEQVLACSYQIFDDLWVQIPAETQETVILTRGETSGVIIDSGIGSTLVQQAMLLEGKAYWEGLEIALAAKEQIIPSLKVLQQFAQVSAKGATQVTVISAEGKPLAFKEGPPTKAGYGLAVDIGTTTVVGYLLDLYTGEELAVGAYLNEQRIFGADVISRISAAATSSQSLEEMRQLVIETINKIIRKVTYESNISPEEIYAVTLAGNTCMHHLLLGLNPANLGRNPFLPVYRRELIVTGGEIGLIVNPEAQVWIFPVIGGFVGGDTVAAIIASDLHKDRGIKMMVDIGTNGELVLNIGGRLVACSAAAGPALEGAHISCGMRAEKGAISKVQLRPDLSLEIIGGGQAKGICGSGLIDLLAELKRAGLINQRGKLANPETFPGPAYLHRRLVKGEKGYKFVLLKAEENEGREIYLNQEDVSRLQLAKGALRGAMELLVSQGNISGNEVEEILLAGAFGNFINIPNAHVIGLLPEWAEGRVRSIGNAAGEGAKITLLDRKKRLEATQISESVEFIELAGKEEFGQAFIKGMLF